MWEQGEMSTGSLKGREPKGAVEAVLVSRAVVASGGLDLEKARERHEEGAV
jgi:hypothetical protein